MLCACLRVQGRATPKNTLLYRREPGRVFPAIVLHDRWYAKAVRQLLYLYRAYRTGACQFGAMLANSVTPSCVDPTWMCSGMRLSPYPGKLLSRLLHGRAPLERGGVIRLGVGADGQLSDSALLPVHQLRVSRPAVEPFGRGVLEVWLCCLLADQDDPGCVCRNSGSNDRLSPRATEWSSVI